jgi:integrase
MESATIQTGNRIGEYMGVPMSRRRFQNPTPRLRRGRWGIVVREDVQGPDGSITRRQKRVFLGTAQDIPTQKIARRVAEPILAQINSTVARPKRVAHFADFARRWSETVLTEMKPSSQTSIRSILRVHLLPAFANRFLYEFTPEMVQFFIARKRQEVSAKTVWNIVMALRSVWNTAVQWRYASEDIFTGVKMRAPSRTEVRCFTAEEVRRILMAAEDPYRTFYWLAAETGMRAGELCGLRWQDVDHEAGIVRVCQSAWRGRIGSPKTSGSVRTFAVSEALSHALAGLRAQGTGEGLIFHSRRGTPWDANLVVKRKLRPLLATLQIPPGGLHAFRHFNATAMDRLRAPVAVMKSRLGHASLATTDRYTHAVSDDDRATAQGITRGLVQ